MSDPDELLKAAVIYRDVSDRDVEVEEPETGRREWFPLCVVEIGPSADRDHLRIDGPATLTAPRGLLMDRGFL